MTKRPYHDRIPLDSADWGSIDVAFGRRMQRVRYIGHVLRDLEDVLARGRLRCMVRSVDDPDKRMLLARAMWTDKIKLEWDQKYGVLVMRRDGCGVFRGWSFYIWLPDLDALWPIDPSIPAPVVAAPRESWFESVKRQSVSLPDPPPPPCVLSDGRPESPKPTQTIVERPPGSAPARPMTAKEQRDAQAIERAADLTKRVNEALAWVAGHKKAKLAAPKARGYFMDECKTRYSIGSHVFLERIWSVVRTRKRLPKRASRVRSATPGSKKFD